MQGLPRRSQPASQPAPQALPSSRCCCPLPVPQVGKMIELLGSKASVSTGKKVYGTAFGEPSNLAHRVEDISDMLVEQGFCYNGKDLLMSGITGAPAPGSNNKRTHTPGRACAPLRAHTCHACTSLNTA